ncbi:MAG: hypothetical protein ACR2P4_07885 [Gammaproteobacteria bacterium]
MPANNHHSRILIVIPAKAGIHRRESGALLKPCKGRPVHSTGQRPVNRRIKQISPEGATENDVGDYDDVGGGFAGLCPAKEWDAPSGL